MTLVKAVCSGEQRRLGFVRH